MFMDVDRIGVLEARLRELQKFVIEQDGKLEALNDQCLEFQALVQKRVAELQLDLKEMAHFLAGLNKDDSDVLRRVQG